MDAIRRELERILEEENIELGGLEITTTIDSIATIPPRMFHHRLGCPPLYIRIDFPSRSPS